MKTFGKARHESTLPYWGRCGCGVPATSGSAETVTGIALVRRDRVLILILEPTFGLAAARIEKTSFGCETFVPVCCVVVVNAQVGRFYLVAAIVLPFDCGETRIHPN